MPYLLLVPPIVVTEEAVDRTERWLRTLLLLDGAPLLNFEGLEELRSGMAGTARSERGEIGVSGDDGTDE